MDTRNLLTQEVVIRDGQPIWRVCGDGICVEHPSGTRAMEMYRALRHPPAIDPIAPCRGPSECDEPGV